MPSTPAESPPPDWAIAQADAGLKIGQSVPEIEQRLVAKGLSPSTAAAAVTAVLEGRVRASQAPFEGAERPLTLHRIASVAVCGVCLVLANAYGGGWSVGKTLAWLMLPVVCIWWAEVMEQNLPPALIRWVAWFALLAILGYRVVLLSL